MKQQRPGWHDALLAFEAEWDDVARAVDAGDGRATEAALTYLETAPRGYRTGYIAERLMRSLSRASFTTEQTERARQVVLAEVGRRKQTREHRYAGALAGAVWNERLAAELAKVDNNDGWEALRARGIAAAAVEWRRSAGRA